MSRYLVKDSRSLRQGANPSGPERTALQRCVRTKFLFRLLPELPLE
jgi:hypothetical protein